MNTVVTGSRWDEAARATLLADTPLFRRLTLDAVGEVARSFRPLVVRRGEAVFRQGEPAADVRLLAEGRVKVYNTVAGRRVTLRLIEPRELFGGGGVWGESVFPAHGLAAVDGVVLHMATGIFRELVASQPALALSLVEELGARLREAEARIRALQAAGAEQRLAQALHRLAVRSGVPRAGAVLIPGPLSRRDLAELAGTTESTASRTLQAWSRAGVVVPGRERIAVTAPDALAAIAGADVTPARRTPAAR
jgi:CRP/FNR family transcriptional regulator, nitrogen oxide reductase regulator